MKRYVTIAVVVLLGLALVAGSVYVVAQSGSEDCETEQRSGAAQACDATCEGQDGGGQGLQLGGGGTREGNGNGSGNGAGNGSGGSQGQGQGQGQRRGASEGESQVLSAVTVEGRVVAHDEELLLDTGDEQLLEVHTGPQWYWDENGYQVSEGDQLRVSGFLHEGEFEAAEIENQTNGQLIELRDGSGRPLWAGRGRGQ
jgi:hypothetical protein